MENRKIKILVAFFILIIPFHVLVENLVTTSLVLPIFSKVDGNIINNFIVLLILGYIIYGFGKSIKRNVFLSNYYIILITVFFFVYVYYRFFGKVWEFTPLYGINKVAYADIFLVFILFEWLKKVLHKPRIVNLNDKDGFLFDNPLEQNDEDKLERVKYAKSICAKISKTENNKSAFSIGINGDWGVGKTSFLNFIKGNLKPSENIIIHFNPWLNNGASSIINEFFKILGNEVYTYNSDLSKKIEQYSKLLLQLENSTLNKAVKPILHLNKLNKTVQFEYSEINSSISKLNKKVIIFIDDLDRLDNDEIIEVIRIIRNTANFANTIFVAAYDRNYLVNALKKINSYNSEFFLEKIFQVEIHLPEYEILTVKKRVFDLIEVHLNDSDKFKMHSLFFDKNHSFSYRLIHDYSENVIRTIRDATRFANSFILSYSHLKGEVNVKDLYYLELLKLKFSCVYNLILQEKDKFFTLADENSSGYSYRNFSYYSLRQIKENNNSNDRTRNKVYKLEKYLQNNLSIVGIHKKSIPSVIAILKFLFPDKESSYYHNTLEPLSIADPNCFDRYSFYRLLDGNLSQVEFEEFLFKTPNEFKIKMTEWISLGLRKEIADKFSKIKEFNNREEFEKTIQGIYNFARIPKQKDIDNDYTGYDSYDFRNKIDNVHNKISDSFYNSTNEYIDFLKSIFCNAKAPFLDESKFIYDLLKLIDKDFIIDMYFLSELRIEFFNKYLESIKSIDLTVFHLYHCCYLTNAIILAGNHSNQAIKSNANPQANKLLIDFVKEKDLDGFLSWCYYYSPHGDDGYSLLNDNILKIFGGFDEFKIFLNEFSVKDHKYLEEFKRFFEECEKVAFKEFVKFNFNVIPPRKN